MSASNYIGDELTLFSNANRWKHYWSKCLIPAINSPVLEVGAGIGSNTALLRKHHENWTCLEPDNAQANVIEHTHPDVHVICGTTTDLYANATFNTILYIDVLEHIENDAAEVQRVAAKLNPGGRLIVLAPAHQALFSPFDKAVGHYRRYNKTSLAQANADASSNLRLEKCFYLDSVGLLASWSNSFLFKQSMPTQKQIWVWDTLMVPVSRLIDPLIGYRAGKTVVAIWQKTP